MEKQKKNDSGITLVALVVSIIVMLVLAGVSLNATIGENGIVTRAQEAALQHKIAEDLENLNLELAKINVDTISTDEAMAIQDIASYLVSQKAIDSFVTTSSGQIAAGIDTSTGNKYFFGTKGDNTYRITRESDGLLSAELTTYSSGGDITGGYALITADSFNNDNTLPATEKGKFTITDDAEVVFMDSISGALSIYVADGVHAIVGIYADMNLSNQGIKRSAIDISKNNGILDLYIGEGVKVTVNSGLGEDASGNTPGKGGYAGIHVPEGATLNLYGKGRITAEGGKAGSGSDSNNYQAGGGGAGAGIGGNGGAGGAGRQGQEANTRLCESGKAGENCGNINIYNEMVVYAYGGGGGRGGTNISLGAGGGGYPAAGIGGGGAGGAGATCCTGAGGYTAGVSRNSTKPQNGLHGLYSGSAYGYWGGGGYYSGPENWTATNQDMRQFCFGGMGGTSWYAGHRPGDGGTAGEGGVIKVSKNSKIYAFNGNLYTDGTAYNSGLNQAPIYLQNGDKIALYIVSDYTDHEWGYADLTGHPYHTNRITLTETQAASKISLTDNKYVNPIFDEDEDYEAKQIININTLLGTTNNPLSAVDMSKQGVGSGAGYMEVSNGSYKIYNEDSSGNFTTEYTGT